MHLDFLTVVLKCAYPSLSFILKVLSATIISFKLNKFTFIG